MSKCEICDKKNDQVKNLSVHDFFNPHELIANFRLSQKFFPKLKTKFPTQGAKLESLYSQKYEPFIKEMLEPNLQKTNQVLQKSFQKKGKLVPKVFDPKNWILACEDCQQTLEKEIKTAVDEIEWGRVEKKWEELGKEMQLIFEQVPEEELKNELAGFGEEEESFAIEFIKQEIDKLNKEIITNRERESKNGKDTNWTPWIIGGSIGGGIILVLILYFLFRKKGKRVNFKK